MFLRNSWEQYKANFKTALVFSLLLVFVPVFGFFQNTYLSSGSIFLDYGLLLLNPVALVSQVFLVALFLVFYSFFVSIIVFSVRKNLSKLKLNFYLREMLQKFTLRIFVFYSLYCLLLFLLALGMLYFGFHMLFVAFALLVVSFVLMFVPQAVVVEEEGLRHAVSTNFEFLRHHPKSFFLVFVIGALMLAVLQLVEFGLSYFSLLASYLSLFLNLVFVLPIVEIMKTYLYMMRFDIIKQHEIARGSKPRVARVEPESLADAPKP